MCLVQFDSVGNKGARYDTSSEVTKPNDDQIKDPDIKVSKELPNLVNLNQYGY